MDTPPPVTPLNPVQAALAKHTDVSADAAGQLTALWSKELDGLTLAAAEAEVAYRLGSPRYAHFRNTATARTQTAAAPVNPLPQFGSRGPAIAEAGARFDASLTQVAANSRNLGGAPGLLGNYGR